MVQSNMSEQDSISEKHGPMWDHDDLSMATWVEDRLRWCVKKDPNYASLASEGFILDRSRVVVPTQFHGVALREGWLVEASVEDPLPPSFIYNDQPIPGGVDHLQEDDAKVSLRACLRVDEAFQMDILNGMQSRSEQKQWKERSGKSALTLIPLLTAQRDAANDARDLAVANALHKLTEDGLACATVGCFTEWMDDFERWNESASPRWHGRASPHTARGSTASVKLFRARERFSYRYTEVKVSIRSH